MLTRRGRILFQVLQPSFAGVAAKKKTSKNFDDKDVRNLARDGFLTAVRRDRATLYEAGPELLKSPDYALMCGVMQEGFVEQT